MKTGKHKIASIVLLMVFFSQQVSWACGYNLSLLVNPPPSSLIYQDHGEFNRWVAKRVYSLTKPSFRHKLQDLKSAYQWLSRPATETVPCSAYVLYNLLQAKGIKPKIEDISASLISLDLKAGNLKPPFTASRIDNSLYAMAKTSEAQGLKLVPVKLSAIDYRPPGHGLASYSQSHRLLTNLTPFIAHLSYGGQSGHFVLVTKVDAEKVYFFYDKGDTFLPLDKFLEEFSGYCLLSSMSVGDSLPAGRQEHCSVPTIADSEAKTILGAGRSYHGRSVNISGLFKKPSALESVIGIASSIGGAFFMPANTSLWATAAGAGIQVGGGLLFKDSMWGRIATGVAAGAVSGGLSGSTFKGALGLSWGFKEAGIGAAKGLGMSGTIEGIKAMNFGDASLRASIANLLAIPVGQTIEGGLSAKFGATIDGIDYKKETSGSFWKGAWMGATFQRSLGDKVSGWKKWAPAIAYYGGQSASIAVEAFGPKKYSSLYSTGISTAFNALTNVAAMGQGDKLWKVLGKSVADGALRGGLSIGLQKLTKDMRITEGAFLEMAGASLISAGVESAFGKWSGESAVSRKGIFWDNLQKSWKGAMQDVVTFGADKGYMLGTRGAYAFLKMHELGSNVGKARASGLSAFDSAHWAFNQHVGSTYHNAAVNTLSNTVWNRVSNVKYVYGVGGKGTKFIAEATQRELNKALSKNNDLVNSKLASSAQKVENGVASSLEQEIKEGLKSNPNSLELQAAQFALINEDVEHASNALKKYQVAEIDQKLGDQSNAGVFGSGSLSPQDTGFINTYGESAWRDQMNQQKVKLSQDISSLTAKIAARPPLIQTLTSNNKPKQLQDSEALTKKPWKIINHNRDTVFRMRHGSINEGQIVEGAPDITSVYNPKTGKYEVIVDKKPVDRYEVDRVEDFVVVGNKTLRRVMEMGSTRFPDVEGGLPNTIPGKDMLEFKDNLEKLALALEEKDMLILNSDPGLTQGQKRHQSQHARGNFPLFPGYQLKPGATESEEIPGYDELINGRMIYGNTEEDPAIMSKQRKDGSVEFNFVGRDVSDLFKIEVIKVQGKRFKIEKELSPTLHVEFANKIKWNQGALAAESLPDGSTTYTNPQATVQTMSTPAPGTSGSLVKREEVVSPTLEKTQEIPKIREGARGFKKSFHVDGEVFETHEEAVKYWDTLKASSGGSKTPKMSAMTIGEMLAEADMAEGENIYLSGTSENTPAKTRGLTLASAGFGEGQAGNKYIQGFIKNEPDTMSDVGQLVISADRFTSAPPVDLQKMSDAQYNKLLSDIDNPGQADVPEWTPDYSTRQNEYSYKDDSSIKTKTINYWNKNSTLNQKVVINSNGERSVERYDDNNGDTVFYLFKNRDGKIDDVDGYNNNGQLINVQKRDDIAGGTAIESAIYDKNGRDYRMINEYYNESGKKIDRIETKESAPPIIRANIAKDYLSDLAATSPVAQNTDSAVIIFRKGKAVELTDHGFKVETPTEKMVSGIGDVYKGEFKGQIPSNVLIQPKIGTDNIISPPGKTNGHFYYDIHNDELNK